MAFTLKINGTAYEVDAEPETPTDQFPNYVPAKFDGIGANEYIVAVTHDAVDFFSAGDTPLHWELNMWYHTLNVGFRTRISGENTGGRSPPQCARKATPQRMYFARSWSARIGSSVAFT